MKRVFISSRAEDRPQVNGLRLLAANPKFEIEFYDESVRTPYGSTNEQYIRRQIREKTNRTSITLCMVGQFTHTSKWVCWEPDESISKGNKIILTGLPSGPESLLLPASVQSQQWWRWEINLPRRMIEASL